MATAKVKIGLPILIAAAGVYYNVPENYVESATGEYINNPKLFEILKTSNTFKTPTKWYEEKINEVHSLFPRNNQVAPEIGEKRIKTIEDYSIRISSDCGSGTAWFLDYEIPKGNKYPTKWFIATNAHVINRFRFKDNPYNQQLPVDSFWFNFGGYCRGANGSPYTNVYLTKEIGTDSKALIQTRDPAFYGLRHFMHESYDSSIMQIKLDDPKLFYVPINFLGSRWEKYSFLKGKRKDYYKDFAVLEVNFPSEESAKIMTNYFFDKKKKSNSEELNLLNFSLLKNKAGKDLMENKDWYFTAGYPGNSGKPLSIFSNYSASEKKASQIIYGSEKFKDFIIRNKHGDPIRGIVDAGKIDLINKNTVTSWNTGKVTEWGYNYVIDNVKLGSGASGSLVTNSNGEVLGLYRMHTQLGGGIGFVEPLRSEGLMENGKIVFPKYDLITGTEGQIGSYKEQLDKYFPNIDTNLRNKWKVANG